MTGATLKHDIHLYGHTTALAGTRVEIIREDDGGFTVYDNRTDWEFTVEADDLEVDER